MSFQETATISRVAAELSEEFAEMGFSVSEEKIRAMISESDVIGDRDTEVWVDSAIRQPGDLKDWPHLVFCVLDLSMDGAVPAKTYRPLT